jgi:iron complex transport system substrate-binding protein
VRSDTHADVRRSLTLVAHLLGTPDEGERAWAQIQREIGAAAARVPSSLRGQAVYVEIGGGAWAAGRASFIGETLAALGMDNIAPAAMGPFPKLNPEFVVRARPAVIITTRRELAGLAGRPGWQSLPAVVNQRLCGFDPAAHDVLVRPGPRLGEAASQLADCMQQVGLR